MNNEVKHNNKKKKEIELKNNRTLTSKMGQSRANEKEYEYNNTTNKKDKNNLEDSSLCFKSELEESKSNQSIKHTNIKIDKECIAKYNNIISNMNSKESNKFNDKNNSIFNYADKLYFSDEHFNQMNLFKKKNSSRDNLLNLKCLKKSKDITNNFDQRTSLSKNEKPKRHRKSLFQKKEEGKDNISKYSKKIDQSMNSKNISFADNKSKDKNNHYAAFFKLKEKNKRPPKIYYIDSIVNNHPKFNSTIKKNNRKQSIKSYKTNTIKSFKKNIIFNPHSSDLKKKDRKREEEFHIIPKKISGMDIDEAQIKETQNSHNNEKHEKQNIKTINWQPTKFLCCLHCKLD